MTMENDFDLVGTPLVSFPEQTAGYPKLVIGGVRTALSPKYTLTGVDLNGTTGDVNIYSIFDALKTTSSATVTFEDGTPDIFQFKFTKPKTCNLIRVNNANPGLDLSNVVIEASNNGTSWTTISDTNFEQQSSYWDLMFTNNTSYFYYRVTESTGDVLDSVAIEELEIYLNNGVARLETSPTLNNNVGDVNFYKATISGFDGTVMDPITAGWTKINGINDFGQSATELAVFDNGLIRIAMDKNQTGEQSCRVYVFNGSAWKLANFSESPDDVWTVTSIEYNTLDQLKFGVSYIDGTFSNTETGFIYLNRGIPAFRLELNPDSAGNYGPAFDFQDKLAKTAFMNAEEGPRATDYYGKTPFTPVGLTDDFAVVPVADDGYDFVVSASKNAGAPLIFMGASAGNDRVVINPRADLADGVTNHWMGFIPRTYSIHSSVSPEIGNTDGHLVEAESFNAWEGERILVGATNLITNGGFETDLSGWAQAVGSWSRVTDESKFNSASVETSGASSSLRQSVNDLVVGSKYIFGAWARTAEQSSGGVTISTGTPVSSLVAGKEWSYLTTIFTATATTREFRLETDAGSTGIVQFDGAFLYEIEDASGNKKLAFESQEASFWEPVPSGTSTVSDPSLNEPRGGKAVRVTQTGSGARSVWTTPLFEPQDWGRFDYLTMWYKNESLPTNTSVVILLRDSNNTHLGSKNATLPAGSGWRFLTFFINGINRNNVARIQIFPETGNEAGSYLIGSMRLSETNVGVGNQHGILAPMEDDYLGWWKLDDVGTPGTEIVLNGGFETYATSPGLPASWLGRGETTSDGSAGVTREKETTIINSGQNSFKLTVDWDIASVSGHGIQSGTLPTDAGKSYYFVAKYYIPSSLTTDTQLTLRIRNVTDTVNVISAPIIGHVTGSWQTISGTFYVDGADTYRVEVDLFRSTTGSGTDILYIDDISILEITADDSSGETNRGILRGGLNMEGPVIGETGQITTCFDFDGTSDFIDVGDIDWDATDNITLSAWANTDTIAPATAKWIAGEGAKMGIGIGTGGNVVCFIAGPTDNITFAAGTMSLGTWHHIVAVFQEGVTKLYLDGKLSGTNTMPTDTSVNAGSDNFAIGLRYSTQLSDVSTSGWDGKIDDVKVLSRAWGANEVAREFNHGKVGRENMRGWYPKNGSTIVLSTDKLQGTKALKVTSQNTGECLQYDFSQLQDFSRFSTVSVLHKQASADGWSLFLDDSAGLRDIHFYGTTTSYTLEAEDLATPDGGTGADLTKISKMIVSGIDVGNELFLDTILFNNLRYVDQGRGDWRYKSNSDASGGYSVVLGESPSITAPATSHELPFSIDFSDAGEYYIGVMAKATGSGGFLETNVDGTNSGTPVAIPTTSFTTQENQLLFGPFTISTPGVKDCFFAVSTVGSMTALELDFAAVYAFESDTELFPKNLANNMLKKVTK